MATVFNRHFRKLYYFEINTEIFHKIYENFLYLHRFVISMCHLQKLTVVLDKFRKMKQFRKLLQKNLSILTDYFFLSVCTLF